MNFALLLCPFDHSQPAHKLDQIGVRRHGHANRCFCPREPGFCVVEKRLFLGIRVAEEVGFLLVPDACPQPADLS